MAGKLSKFPKKPLFLNIMIWIQILGFLGVISQFPKYFANFNSSVVYILIMFVITLITVFGLVQLKKWSFWLFITLVIVQMANIIRQLFAGLFLKSLAGLSNEVQVFAYQFMIVVVVVTMIWLLVQMIYIIKIRKIFK